MKFVFDNTKSIFESMTREEILTAIVQAVESHEIGNVDTGFITTIAEQNGNVGLTFWVGTTAEYNAISPKQTNCFYILTDDDELSDIESALENLEAVYNDIISAKGQVLLNQTVNYGSFSPIQLIGTKPVDEYSIVKVTATYGGVTYEVLCDVFLVSSAAARINGSLTTGRMEYMSAPVIFSIWLGVDRTHNTLTANSSTYTTISGTPTMSQLKIEKITGVI